MEYKTHVGVYAIITDGTEGKILLIRKARGPYTGMLDLPGGSIEAEELVDEALAREIDEETSCKLVSSQQLGTQSIRYPYTDPKTQEPRVLKHIGILYSAKVTGEPSVSGDGLDSDGAHWFAISELKEGEVTPFVLSGLRLIGK